MNLNPGILDQATASDLVDLSIQDKWLKIPSAEYMEAFRRLCNVRTGNMDETVKDTSMSGGGSFQRKAEGQNRPKDKPIQGFDKSATIVEYSVQLEVTKRMWVFGIQKNKIENLVQSYKIGAMERRERDFEDRLNNSYSTSYTEEGGDTVTLTGGDGLALFSSSHTREDAGTNNNNIVYDGTTYNMDYDYDALKALALTAKLVKGLRGEEMSINPSTVVVQRNSAVAFRAKEINGAVGMPGGNDNDANAVGKKNIEELSYLTNTGYWFAVDPSFIGGMYGFQYVETQDITLGAQIINEDSGNFKYNVDAMWEYYHNDYRGWFGSKGTNAV